MAEMDMKAFAEWMRSDLADSQAPGFIDTLPEKLRQRSLMLESVPNARQLGGYSVKDGRKVRKGVLLRTAALGTMSQEDANKLQDTYHLRLVLDLRSSFERVLFPDAEVEGAENISESLNDEQAMKDMPRPQLPEGGDMRLMSITMASNPRARERMPGIYRDMLLSDYIRRTLADCFHRILALKGGTALWHCAQGKDRCGMLSVLLLGALGAEDPLILDDFDESNTYYAPFIAKRLEFARGLGCDKDTLQAYRNMLGVERAYMANAVDYMNSEYGSVEGFVKDGLGIGAQGIEALRGYYLE